MDTRFRGYDEFTDLAKILELLLVAQGRAQPFNGDLADYCDWLNEQQRAVNRDAAPRDANNGKPLQQQIKKLEQRLEKLHNEQTRLQGKLAKSALYENAHKNCLKAALLRKAQADKELADIKGEWLEAQET